MFRDIGGIVLLLWRTLQALPLAFRHRRKVLEQCVGSGALLLPARFDRRIDANRGRGCGDVGKRYGELRHV